MTEKEWPAAPLYQKIDFLEDERDDHRRLRLFACACCRRVWDLLRLDAARNIVDLAEGYADSKVSEEELQEASDPSYFPDLEAQYRGQAEGGDQLSRRVLDAISAARYLASPSFDTSGGASLVAQDTSRDPAHDYIPDPETDGVGGPPGGVRADEMELNEKERLLLDIFANPFRPVTFDPAWRTSTAVALAEQMYESREFALMPILGDALEDAGCDNEDILSHCRGDGPHVRGCWVVDLILGKEELRANVEWPTASRRGE